jgi:hypothetical protein
MLGLLLAWVRWAKTVGRSCRSCHVNVAINLISLNHIVIRRVAQIVGRLGLRINPEVLNLGYGKDETINPTNTNVFYI